MTPTPDARVTTIALSELSFRRAKSEQTTIASSFAILETTLYVFFEKEEGVFIRKGRL